MAKIYIYIYKNLKSLCTQNAHFNWNYALKLKGFRYIISLPLGTNPPPPTDGTLHYHSKREREIRREKE